MTLFMMTIIYRNLVEFPEPSSNYIITLMAYNAAGEGPPAYESAITREEQGANQGLHLSSRSLPS